MPLETKDKPSKHAKRIMCVHEAGHVVIGWSEPLMSDVKEARVRFRRRSGYTRFKAWHVSLRDERDYLADIATDLAGPMAEKIVFGRWTNMNERDLKNAWTSAHEMVCKHGMSPLGQLHLAEGPISQAMAARVEAEIEKILAERASYVERRLNALRKKLDKIAELLLERKRIGTDEIEEAIGKRPKAPPEAHPKARRKNARRK